MHAGFAELLLDEAAQTLRCMGNDQLKTELKELRLLSYCRRGLEQHGQRPAV